MRHRVGLILGGFWTALVAASLATAAPAQHDHAAETPAPASENAAGEQASEGAAAPNNVVVDKGIKVEFSIEPAYGPADEALPILEGKFADVRLRVTDAESGTPVSPLQPAVWISRVGGLDAELSCQERISRYLQGLLSFQADIDLNKYFILILNDDRSISVVDPLLGVSGITQLYTMIPLKEPGEDWLRDPQGERLFVTMPEAGAVAVVDLKDFKVVQDVEAGTNPVRIAVQPDGKYLWVGNDVKAAGQGGVTVIDAHDLTVVASVTTGGGHHEIAFSDDSLFAFVTNSIDDTVSIIDTQRLEKVKDLATGKAPVAVRFSASSRAIYVASHGDGKITVVEPAEHEITKTIETAAGVVALTFAPGGRWGFAANVERDRVDIIDASRGAVVRTLEVGSQPHQFAFTDTYAYVRHLGSADVTLIPLAQLVGEGAPAIKTVPLGTRGPGQYPAPSVADAIAPTGEWTAVVAANPADKMVYYYMEGMIAPMGSYTTYGRVPRAVAIADRSVRETDKGVYAAKIRVPSAGEFNVAVLIDSPVVDHCFSFEADADPLLAASDANDPVRIDYLDTAREVAAGQTATVRFALTRSRSKQPVEGLRDVTIIATRSPGRWQERARAVAKGDGVYEVEVSAEQPGVYFVTVAIPSLDIDFTELRYMTFRAASLDSSTAR